MRLSLLICLTIFTAMFTEFHLGHLPTFPCHISKSGNAWAGYCILNIGMATVLYHWWHWPINKNTSEWYSWAAAFTGAALVTLFSDVNHKAIHIVGSTTLFFSMQLVMLVHLRHTRSGLPSFIAMLSLLLCFIIRPLALIAKLYHILTLICSGKAYSACLPDLFHDLLIPELLAEWMQFAVEHIETATVQQVSAVLQWAHVATIVAFLVCYENQLRAPASSAMKPSAAKVHSKKKQQSNSNARYCPSLRRHTRQCRGLCPFVRREHCR